MGASTILVLDDGRHTLEALTDALEKAGYAVIGVTEGDDPTAQFSATTPELVFLSLHVRTALHVCEQIRATGDGAIVPIIFVGNGHREVRSPSEALAHGGDYHFGEPLELSKILAKVQTYVGIPPGAPMASIPVMKAKASVSGTGSDWHGGAAPAIPPPAGVVITGMTSPSGAAPTESSSVVELPKLDWPKGVQVGGSTPAPSNDATDLASASDDLLAQIEAESRVKTERTEKTEALAAPTDTDREITAVTDLATVERDARAQRRSADERANAEAARLEAARQAAEIEARRLVEEQRSSALAEADRLIAQQDAATARAEAQRLFEAEKHAAAAAKKHAEEEAARVAAERLAAEAEAQRVIEAERHALAAARRRAEEEQTRAASERLAAEADAQRAIEAQRQAVIEARRRADEEAARLEAERKAAEAEAQRGLEAQRRAAAEARRRAEEEAARIEVELKAAEAEAQRAVEAQRQAAAAARRQAEEVATAERKAAEADAARLLDEQRRAAAEARRRAEEEAALLEAERKAAEAEAQRGLEQQRQAAAEARRRTEQEAARIEAEHKAAQAEAQRIVEAQRRAAAEAKRRAEQAADAERTAAEADAQRIIDEQRRAAAESRRRAQEEAARIDAESKAAEAEAERLLAQQRQATAEARRRAEEESQRILDEQRKTTAEARRLAEEEAQRMLDEQRKTSAEARRLAEEEAQRMLEEQRKATAEARRLAEEEAQRMLEDQRKAIAETRRRAEEEAARFDEERRLAQAETERVAAERRKLAAEADARRKAEEIERAAEEARRRLEDEAKRAEAERRAAEEARLQAIADEARRKGDEIARRKFGTTRPSASVDEAATSAAASAPTASLPPDRPEAGVALAGEAAPFAASARTVNPSAIEHGPRPAFRAPVPEEGTFSATADIADLVAELVRQQVTGRVDFTSGTRQKSLVLERGHPVDAYSSQVFDRMEEYLLREGRITRQQYNEVRIKGLRGPRRIGAYLTSEGYLRPDELFSAVRGHLEELVYSLFEWEEGTYSYVQAHVDDDDRVMLDKDPRALIVEGIRRKYLLPRTLQKLGSPSSLLVRTDPEGRVDSEALGLSGEERQVARLIDGSRNIEDIVFSSGLDTVRVYHVLAALVATGAAEVAVRGIEGVNSNGATKVDDIDAQRIRDRVEQARQSDYFQILGLPRSATTYEVEAAFDRIRRELAPGKISPSVRAMLRSELDEIERVLEDARDVLRDPRMRDSYAKHLPG